MRILGLNAAKEKLEIVSGAAPPPFRIFAGGIFRKNAFGLIQEYCTDMGVKAPKFISNKDNNHCLQASVWMALEGRVKLEEVNKMTNYEDYLYSWTPAAVDVINEKIPGTKLFSALDYEQFAQRGEEYLKEYWATIPQWYSDQKAHASEGFNKEQLEAKNILDKGLFIHKVPTKTEIEGMLSNGNLLIALVNSSLLSGEEGNIGHFVFLYGQDKGHFMLHDPGPPPNKKWKIKKEKFMEAFRYELLMIPKALSR